MTLLAPPDHTTPMVKTLKSAGDVPVTEVEDIKADMVPGRPDQNTLEDWLTFLSGGVYRGRWRPGYLYKKGDIVDIAGEDNFFKALVDVPSQRTGPGVSLLHWLPLNNWRGVFSDLKSYHTGSFIEHSGSVYLAVYNINYGSGITPEDHAGWVRLSDAESLYKGPWASTNTYFKGDMVENGSGLFISRTNSLSSQTGPGADPDNWAPLTDWRGDWDTAQYYPTGTTVKHNDQVWFAIGNSTPSSPEPSGTHSKWARISPQFRSNWNTNNTYYRAEMVWHNNHMWMCRNNNVLSGSGPDSDGDNWDPLPVFRGNYASSGWYQKGDITLYQDQIWLTTGAVVNNERPGSHANWVRISDRYRGTWALNTSYKSGDITLHSSQYYIARSDGTPTSNSSSPSNNSSLWRRISFEGTNLGSVQEDGYVDITSSTGANTSIYDASSSASGTMSTSHYSKLEALPNRSTYDNHRNEKANTDLQNIDNNLSSTEKGVVRNRIGAGTGDDFWLHGHVNRYVSTGIAGSDRIVFSDESATGQPNTYTTFTNFKSSLNIPPEFSLHHHVHHSSTITGEDRILFADQSIANDPNRYTTFASFKTALNLPDPSLKADVNLGNISSSISETNKATIRTKIGAGRPFKISRDVAISASIASADKLIFSDESTSGDPNRHITFSSFVNAIDIPSYISQFKIWDDVDTSAVIGSSDRIPFADASDTNHANKYTTLANLRSALSIPTEWHIYNDTTAASIHDSDFLAFADRSATGSPNKRISVTDFKEHLAIPDISGKADTDLQNLDSDLTTNEKSTIRTRIGAGTSSFSGMYDDLSGKPTIPGVFSLNSDVSTTITSLSSSDLMLIGDASDSNANKKVSLSTFRSWLNIPATATGFDLYSDVTTNTTPSDSDLFVIADVSVSGEPNRNITFSQLKSALNIPAASTGFVLSSDVTNTATIADSDLMLIGDVSETSSPNRRITARALKTYMSIPSISGLAQDDLSNLDSALSDTEKSSIRTKIGAGSTSYNDLTHKPTIPTAFKLWSDVTSSATPGNNDRFVFGDSSDANNANKYVTLASLKTAMGLPDPFDIYTDVMTAHTPNNNSRFIFASVDESGEPNKYVKLSDLRTALSIPDISTKLNTNLSNVKTDLTDNQKSTFRSRIGAGDGTWLNLSGKPDIPSAFDLATDVTSSATPASDDIFLLSDTSDSNSHKFVTHANLKSSFNIPAATPAFDLHDHVDTSATIADDDRMVFSDESDAAAPNRYVTAADLKSYIDVPTSYPWTSVTGKPDHLVAPQRLGAQWIGSLPTREGAYVISHTFGSDTSPTYILIPNSGMIEINAYNATWVGGTVRIPSCVLRASREATTTAFIHQVGEYHNSSAYGISFCCNAQNQLMIWSNTRTASSNYYIDVLWWNNGYWDGGVPDHTMPQVWPNLRAD